MDIIRTEAAHLGMHPREVITQGERPNEDKEHYHLNPPAR